MKIGEVVSASVIGGITAKLQLPDPEELRIAYPAIVEGQRYDFYCLVEDIMNQESDIADQLAGSSLGDVVLPRGDAYEGYSGPIFYSKAKLKAIQLIDRETGALSEPQTIPPYFSECRHATKRDVEFIYERTEKSSPIGTITGVEKFYVHIDFAKLAEKPFGIFGRTGTGKTILNKLVCCAMLAKDAASVLIFDMHAEYGLWSKTDKTEGLKFFFPGKVEVFSLDGKDRDARPFVLDPAEISPEDLIVAIQDLSAGMIDTIYEINRTRGSKDLITAIKDATLESIGVERTHEMSLQALKRRMGRIDRLPFLRPGMKDAFTQITGLVRDGKSIVLDFGDFGTDQMVYLFVANVLSRRLFEVYSERNEEFPRLVVFVEEAHKFLDPQVQEFTIFSKLARETRKFNLILALVDQRPARISDEVRSQLANRFVMSLKEPSDVDSALAGVPDKSMWSNIIGNLPLRTVAVLGDAIRIPTVIDIMEYGDENVREYIVGSDAVTEGRLERLAGKADEVFGS